MTKKEDLYKFIELKVGIPINDKTVFFEDLGIDGLDAISLMDEIAFKYKLDLSSYNYLDYHDAESQIANPFLFIKRIFGRAKRKKKFKAIHLYEVVEKGKWF